MGRANQLLHWIKSNKYSGYSGELNKFDSNEQSLFCPTSSSMIYPSISPCVLAMVTKDDEILLARNNLFPKGLYSVLAGFVEVSESAEETVHREVLEEVNIKVKNINLNLEEIENIDFNQIIKFIAMISPFSDIEKQVLLETKNLSDFYKKLHSIIELEIVEDNNSKTIN